MYSLNSLQSIIEKKIEEIPLTKKPYGLYEPVKYILEIGGKRIRPALVLASCNIFSDDISPAFNTALAFEIFHNFTLLHDDVMDNSSMRRGRETVHKKWNVNTAILSGDTMMIIAYDYIHKSPIDKLLPIIHLFNKTAAEVCEGQQFDMEFESSDNVNVPEYLKMIELKTSVLIAAALKAGAIIGGASESDAECLYNFGLNLGIAFQLQDDYLDVYGNTETFGKQIGGDIMEAKKTFLMITALQNADESLKSDLLNILNNRELDRTIKINNVIEIYNSLNIKEQTISKIYEYYNLALQEIEKVSVSAEKTEVLLLLAESIRTRNK